MTRSAIAAAGHTFRKNNISQRVQSIVISPIKEMSILAHNFAVKSGADIVSFGQGIPFLDTPPHIKKAITKALTEWDTARYTLEPGIPELRELIGKFLKREKGISSVKPQEEIMVSAGCQEALVCALASVMDPGDEVLLPEPAFASYTEQIIQLSGVPIQVPMKKGKTWKLDLVACAKAVTKKTRAMIMCNPSNPTGGVLSKAEVVALAAFIKKHDLILITDETYDFLTYEGMKHYSPAAIASIRDRVILCGSFSKKYSMTGYRIGYAFADSGIIDHMLKVHDALMICAPAVSQKAVMAALSGPQSCVKDTVKKMTINRELMCRELDSMSEIFEYIRPQGAYYILVRVKRPGIQSFALALQILHDAHVIVIPGAAFGPSGEGHIRMSFAGKPSGIKEGFKRLKKWHAQWKKSGYPLAK